MFPWQKSMNKATIYLLEQLIRIVGQGELKNDGAYFAEELLIITAEYTESDQQMIQVIFTAESPLFQKPLIENFLAGGADEKQMFNRAAENYSVTVLLPLIQAVEQQETEILAFHLVNQSLTFNIYKSEVLYTGLLPERLTTVDLFDLIKDELVNFLGAERFYIIKIYSVFSVEEYRCEVSINGRINTKLSDIIAVYAQSWQNQSSFYTEKQQIFLRKSDATYLERTYTETDVIQTITEIVSLLGNAHDDVYDEALLSVKSKAPVGEVYHFLIEICCAELFSEIPCSDEIVLVNRHKKYRLHQEQLRLCQEVQTAIKALTLSEKTLKKAAAKSNRFQQMVQSLNQHIPEEALCLAPLILTIDDDYLIY